jgi:hypothetical protein
MQVSHTAWYLAICKLIPVSIKEPSVFHLRVVHVLEKHVFLLTSHTDKQAKHINHYKNKQAHKSTALAQDGTTKSQVLNSYERRYLEKVC